MKSCCKSVVKIGTKNARKALYFKGLRDVVENQYNTGLQSFLFLYCIENRRSAENHCISTFSGVLGTRFYDNKA
jgi:hypothetical protein